MGSNYLRLLSYTKQLSFYANHGNHEQALALFHHMQASLALALDAHVFSLVLKSCTAIRRPQLGTAIHAHATKSSLLSSPFVACALVDMYGKSMSVSLARKLFDEIPHRTVVAWNAMLSLYTHSNMLPDALRLFEAMDVPPNTSSFNPIIAGLLDDGFKAIAFYRKMQQCGLKPNLITLLALLPASVGVAALDLIKQIHGFAMRNDLGCHPQLGSGLVEAYGRCGCLNYAHNVFDKMHERDVVAWSSLISAHALHGEARTALNIFQQMELCKVQPDEITFIGVLKACSHVGLADEALDYFSRMQRDYGLQASSDHYSCLVDALSRAGRLHEAYEIIREMPVRVTAKAWGALLGACRNYGELELAEIAGKALFDIEPENAANYVLLGKMYASVGRHEEAQRLRMEMKERRVKAVPGSSWVVYQD
ncbi:putative pentatricopeptide repeat-containing protein, partial [Cucurbita argyrosperma subsp. sororia]